MVMISRMFLKNLFIISFSVIILLLGGLLLYADQTPPVSIDVETLENGLKVILYNKPGAPYGSIQILIGAGSVTEGQFGGSGITHFIEHLLFKGTLTRDWDQITREIESYGGYFNASTTYDYTTYYVTIGNEYIIRTLFASWMGRRTIFEFTGSHRYRSICAFLCPRRTTSRPTFIPASRSRTAF